MAKPQLAVHGYRDLMRGLTVADKETRRYVRAEFRQAGESIRADAQHRFAPVDARSAAGYKTRVRQRGIAIEQSRRKTTGRHPEYGALQMRRALIPARSENMPQFQRSLEVAMDRVCAHFNRG